MKRGLCIAPSPLPKGSRRYSRATERRALRGPGPEGPRRFASGYGRPVSHAGGYDRPLPLLLPHRSEGGRAGTAAPSGGGPAPGRTAARARRPALPRGGGHPPLPPRRAAPRRRAGVGGAPARGRVRLGLALLRALGVRAGAGEPGAALGGGAPRVLDLAARAALPGLPPRLRALRAVRARALGGRRDRGGREGVRGGGSDAAPPAGVGALDRPALERAGLVDVRRARVLARLPVRRGPAVAPLEAEALARARGRLGPLARPAARVARASPGRPRRGPALERALLAAHGEVPPGRARG